MSKRGRDRNIFSDLLHDANESSAEEQSSDSGSDSDFIAQNSSDEDSSTESEASDASYEDVEPADEYYTGKDGGKWYTTPPSTSRTPQRNILHGPTQKVVHADHVVEEVAMFKLYITENMVKRIVIYTNKEGKRVAIEKGKGEKDWKGTDETEIWALIGVLVTAGYLKQNMVDTDLLWSKQYGIPIIKAAMSQQRFHELMGMLRYDDKETRGPRREKDKFAAFREVWELFVTSLGRYYIPGANLTVDEQLVPFRGRCSFIQYMPAKPDKYGIKLFWIVDSENYYPLKCRPYLGKEGRSVQVGLGRQITLELCRPFFHSSRNITADNFFTDQALGLELLSNGLTLVGTVRKNKRFLPPQFSSKKGLDVRQSVFGFQQKTTIVNYQCKKSKSVTLLSTMHKTTDVDNTPKKKPEIVLYYNETKGGVDTMDQMAHSYTTKRKTKRWPMVMFMNMLDIAGIAAFAAWKIKYPTWMTERKARNPRRYFLQSVAEDMILPQLTRRREIPQLSNQLKDVIATVVCPSTSTANNEDEATQRKRRRCCICPTKKDRKSQQSCSKCTRSVCKEHSIVTVVCKDCLE